MSIDQAQGFTRVLALLKEVTSPRGISRDLEQEANRTSQEGVLKEIKIEAQIVALLNLATSLKAITVKPVQEVRLI